MDATRSRRTRDTARQRWYASCRCRRLARLLGFEKQSPAERKPTAPLHQSVAATKSPIAVSKSGSSVSGPTIAD